MNDSLILIEQHKKINIDWCTIFNSYSFFELHKNNASNYFTLNNGASDEIIGVCHFYKDIDGTFKSPQRGTFAGFELIKNDIQTLTFFLKQIELCLIEKGAKNIEISSAPFFHNLTFSSHLFNVLFNSGYEIRHEINHSIAVTKNDLATKMHRSGKKRLNKCIREGFTFTQAQNTKEFQTVYNVISANRKNKGYPISMTYKQIYQMLESFPDSVYFFFASHNDKAVAGSICIKINKEVLYVFYWGDSPGYEQFSPISFLADGIYKFAQKNHFSILDAGTSTHGGLPNLGLVKFKENLGFLASLKLTYSKRINQ